MARVQPSQDGSLGLLPGDYGKDGAGQWWARVPEDGNQFPAALLVDHTVTEHEDGTISVQPSLLMELSTGQKWHGWLERGVWRKD